jgi:formate--tetrahydrofolate ligase
MKKINDIVESLNIPDEYIELYGKYKAKISNEYLKKINNNKQGKLILVTATNPTPMGEGKTTQSIGLSMSLNDIGKKSIVCLREPSLGPVFGVKGGAIGGGKSTVEPSQDINLHFTGDFHKITSANNLLCAVVDNHIFQGNTLKIDKNKICIKRVIDINDRSLRHVRVGSNNDDIAYDTGFELTVASELMAICALSLDKEELRKKIDNMIVAYDIYDNPVYVKSFNVTNAMLALLENILSPNLVQTIECTPSFVHMGPFANIAHGCSSLIATKMALKMADYVVTEAGFGADLGAEKFIDIKCRIGDIKPDVAVLVTTIKSIKYNGGINIDELESENIKALEKGILNLKAHIENLQKFGIPVVVCLNKFKSDTDNEIEYVKKFVEKIKVRFEISTVFDCGSIGGKKLAETVIDCIENENSNLNFMYKLEENIEDKILDISKKIYGAKNVIYTDVAKEKIARINNLKKNNLPICIAKTPFSFSDNPKILGRPIDFDITINDIKLNNGAGFIVAYAGNVLTMPGLSKNSNYEKFK